MSKEIIGRGQPSISSKEREIALHKLKKHQQEWELMRHQLTQRGKAVQASGETAPTSPSTSSDLRAGRK